MTNILALLIAAGESRRMGAPKQLLPWRAKTLIEHQIETLQNANISVSVILGANSELIQKKIEHLNVQILHNKNWEKGMGTSIACGARQIMDAENSFEGILISLVDQPLITTEHFQNMIAIFEAKKKQIIVSESEAGLRSAPVLFDKSYLNVLMKLDGETGAKPIIRKNEKYVFSIKCKNSLEDMDTPEAYQRMLKIANLQS